MHHVAIDIADKPGASECYREKCWREECAALVSCMRHARSGPVSSLLQLKPGHVSSGSRYLAR